MWFIFHPPIFLVVRWLFVFLQEIYALEDNGTSNEESLIDLMSNQAQKGLITRSPWADNRNNGKLTQDIWYTMELEYDGSVVTAKILNGNNTVWSGTLSSTKTINYIGFCTLGKNSSYKFRKLKVKAL